MSTNQEKSPEKAEMARKVIEGVARIGEERARNFGAEFNEVDYVMGAAAAMEAMDLWAYVPALWLFGPLANKPIFGKSQPEQAQAE